MRKTNTAIMSLVMCAAMLLSACGGAATSASTPAATQAAQTEKAAEETKESAQETPAPAGDVVTIQIGFENTTEEPIGKAVEKWAELLAAESSGTMKLELFPNSSLGSKSELIDSDWYQTECGKLADKGLTVLASNWVYGERELMTKTKVVTPGDIKGKKSRLANSQIYVEGFNALGATAVPMALGDVYTSLQNGTLDGVENPLSTLYGQSFQEVSKNILMTGHILNFTTWCIGTDYLNTLTPEQQELLYKTGEEAGLYNNEQQAAANDDYRKKLEEAGVTFTELTDEERALWKEASLSFYEKGSQFGWSDGLYDTVKAAMQ